jgi:hypothetical protein
VEVVANGAVFIEDPGFMNPEGHVETLYVGCIVPVMV